MAIENKSFGILKLEDAFELVGVEVDAGLYTGSRPFMSPVLPLLKLGVVVVAGTVIVGVGLVLAGGLGVIAPPAALDNHRK